MRILRVKLKNYRGVTEREVRLAPGGVTIIQGPNEIGKSSLAEAVDVIFKHLDSSTHREVKSIKPVHADEGAEVEVDVECGHYAFTLFKRFHKRAATRLDVTRPRPESLTGREAHERARGILAEFIDLDLWDALRIQQGTGVEQADLKDQSALAGALEKAAGGTPSGEGEESLFEAARKELDRYFTETGKPRKELEELEKAVNAARQELDSIDRALAAIEADIARCERLEGEIARLRGEQARLKSYADKCQEQWHDIQTRRAALASLEARWREVQASENGAASALEERLRLVAGVRGSLEEQARLRSEDEAAAPQRVVARNDQVQAEAELREARAAAEAADRNLELRRQDHDFRRDELDLIQLRERQKRIDAALEQARAAEELLRQTRITDALLAEIGKAHLAVEVARARLQAMRTELHVEALGALEVEIGGARTRLAPGERRDLPVEGSLELVLPGLARLAVRSGASSTALAEEHERLHRRLIALCEKGNVASLAAAHATNEERRDAERVKAQKDRVLEESLRDLKLEDIGRKIVELELRCAEHLRLRPQEPTPAGSLEEALALKDRAQQEAAQAAGRRGQAEKADERVRAQVEAHRAREIENAALLKSAAERSGAAEKALEEARSRRPDEELRRALDAAAAAARDMGEQHAAAAARLAAEQPELAEERARNARAAFESAARQLREQENDWSEVIGSLRARGEEGLEARRGEKRARLERLLLERAGTLARAGAARLLFETLREKRDAARSKYVAPLRGRIERLGRFVFGPSFQVELGEDLQIKSRTYEGRTVPFRDLSIGAQEQLGVISRLACAITVAADGGVPVILDDALGYSDPRRLEEMGAVLALAGREAQVQVIVLTCMPERYRNVGNATVVRLG